MVERVVARGAMTFCALMPVAPSPSMYAWTFMLIRFTEAAPAPLRPMPDDAARERGRRGEHERVDRLRRRRLERDVAEVADTLDRSMYASTGAAASRG